MLWRFSFIALRQLQISIIVSLFLRSVIRLHPNSVRNYSRRRTSGISGVGGDLRDARHAAAFSRLGRASVQASASHAVRFLT